MLNFSCFNFKFSIVTAGYITFIVTFVESRISDSNEKLYLSLKFKDNSNLVRTVSACEKTNLNKKIY